MTSGVKTSPLSSQSCDFSSLSTGLPGSILLATPSRPAMRHAAKDRYGLQVGSGVRNSIRLAPSDFEYIGMRMHADRLRWLYTRLMGASYPGTRRLYELVDGAMSA